MENFLIKNWFITKKINIIGLNKPIQNIPIRYVEDSAAVDNYIDISHPWDVIISTSSLDREIKNKNGNIAVFTDEQLKFMAMISPNNLNIKEMSSRWLISQRQAKNIIKKQHFLINYNFEVKKILDQIELEG